MAQLLSTAHSTDIPPAQNQRFMADASTPFDTVTMVGKNISLKTIDILQEAARKAAKKGKNTLIIGDGESDISTNYTELLQGKTSGNTQIILCGHGKKRNNHHFIGLVKGQKDIAHTVQDIVSTSGENPPHRVFVFSCYAEAAKENFLKTQSSVQVILDGSNHPTLLGLNLEAISTLINEGHLAHLSREGGINQHALYDTVSIILKDTFTTHVPLTIFSLVNGGTPQLAAPEILQKRLLLATARENTTKVKQLLDLGVNPNKVKNPLKTSPLHLAAESGHTEIVEILLEHGAHPNLPDIEGTTPLHLSIYYRHPATVEALIKHDANPNAQNYQGFTPLHFAAENGDLTVVEILLEHGADPRLPDIKGIMPLHFAAENGHTEIVRKLLAKGANPNAQNHQKFTPLHFAAENGHTEIVEILLEHGADPNLPDIEGTTPLHFAAENGHTEIVRKLLTKGADPNLPDIEGITPLHFATFNGHPTIVEVLLQHGADPHTLNKKRLTPKDYLEFVEDPEKEAAIERMLEQAERTWPKEQSASTSLEDVKTSSVYRPFIHI